MAHLAARFFNATAPFFSGSAFYPTGSGFYPTGTAAASGSIYPTGSAPSGGFYSYSTSANGTKVPHYPSFPSSVPTASVFSSTKTIESATTVTETVTTITSDITSYETIVYTTEVPVVVTVVESIGEAGETVTGTVGSSGKVIYGTPVTVMSSGLYSAITYTYPASLTPGEIDWNIPDVAPKPSAYGGPSSYLYHGPGWLPAGASLVPALPQSDTNGDSYWGLPDAPHLPPYLPGNRGSPYYPISYPPAPSSSAPITKTVVYTTTFTDGTETIVETITTAVPVTVTVEGASSSPASTTTVVATTYTIGDSTIVETITSSVPVATSSASASGPGASTTVVTSTYIVSSSTIVETVTSIVPASSSTYYPVSGSASGSGGSGSGTGSGYGSGTGSGTGSAASTGFSTSAKAISSKAKNSTSAAGTGSTSVALSSGTTASGSAVGTGTGTASQPTSSANSSSPEGGVPNTGVTRHYNFTVSYMTCAPDGVEKSCLVINKQFPGPLIEANWGDMIEVTVTNDLDDEGTSIHWHGILQSKTPWFDGVPSVSQCPIIPGATFTYKFQADLYGSSWYHSHYSAQYAGGALGPMIIHGPKHESYDIDIGPVILSDWYHGAYFGLVNRTMEAPAPGLPMPSNNNLINGKMNYPCANTTQKCTPNAGISKFKFTSGKKHLLRLINTSGDAMQKFSIDNHTLTIIANDFVPLKPYTTNVVTLGVGQRTDIIVEATGKSGDAFWMRSQLGVGQASCSLNDGVSPNAVAAVYYENANTTAEPTTTSDVTSDQLYRCSNDPLDSTEPYDKITPSTTPATVQQIDIKFGNNGTNFLWYMNNVSFRGDYNEAILDNAHKGDLDFGKHWNVYNFGSNSSVQLVVYNHFAHASHPMHLHGHNFWVMEEGFGTWNGSITQASNPIRRDVQILQKAQNATVPSYIVLQYNQDNPGVWPFHCHIAWHVSAGLYINALEQPDKIKSSRDVPASVADTCSSWGTWTGSNIPDQIDSGL